MLLLYIFGPIGFAILSLPALVKIYRHRWEVKTDAAVLEARIKEFHHLLDRAKQGDQRAQETLVDGEWRLKDPKSNPETTAFLRANKKKVRTRRLRAQHKLNWERCGVSVKRAFETWQKAVGTEKEPYLCAAFVWTYWNVSGSFLPKTRNRLIREIGLTPKAADDQLRAVTGARYWMLAAKLEDAESFHELRRLVLQTHEGSSDIRNAGIKSLRYPEGWNDAAARHLENPALGDLIHEKDPEPGRVRLWGEEALRTNHAPTAKLVLAYANSNKYYREELGDVLTHELGKLVEKYSASLVAEVPALESSV